jgi:hypothetical protein
MKRIAWWSVPVCLIAFVPMVSAKRIAAPPSPVQRALQAEVVVTGKVTSIEKEPVEIESGGQKTHYKVAVIKIESALVGAANTTHIKVGFPAGPGGGRGRGPIVSLEVNQEGLFFLTKHPSGAFHTFNWMGSPVPSTDESYKAVTANVKKALAIVAEPMKSLKAEKADDRAFAAIALIIKNRTIPQIEGKTLTLEKLPAEQSKLILKGLSEANWTKFDPNFPPPATAFYMLGLTTEDGWNAPKVQPGADFNSLMREAFEKWIEGPGKDYRINKFVVKK